VIDTLQAARGNVARWRREPINFVREQFGTEPDEWQADALAALEQTQSTSRNASARLAAFLLVDAAL
jgi:hypothetical protein